MAKFVFVTFLQPQDRSFSAEMESHALKRNGALFFVAPQNHTKGKVFKTDHCLSFLETTTGSCWGKAGCAPALHHARVCEIAAVM